MRVFGSSVDLCPLCQQKEKWQTEEGKKNKECKYFFSLDEALAWGEICVDKIIDHINEMRKHPELILTAKKALINNNTDIDQLKRNLSKSKNRMLVQKLTEESNQLLNMRKQLGVFDFKEKKEADRRMQEIRQKKEVAESAYNKEKKEAAIKILQKKIEMIDAKYIAYGCTGAIQYKENNNIRGLFPEEYEIITEDLEAYRNQSIIQSEHSEYIEEKMKVKQDNQKDKKKEIQPNEVKQSIFCRKCGEKLPEDSRFCYKCGTEIRKE